MRALYLSCFAQRSNCSAISILCSAVINAASSSRPGSNVTRQYGFTFFIGETSIIGKVGHCLSLGITPITL